MLCGGLNGKETQTRGDIWACVADSGLPCWLKQKRILPAIRETWVSSLGRENCLEKTMATHSSILAWRIPRREEPGGLQSMGSQRVGDGWATNTSHFTRIHFVVWQKLTQHWKATILKNNFNQKQKIPHATLHSQKKFFLIKKEKNK